MSGGNWLIKPDSGYPWVLGIEDGEVVRLSKKQAPSCVRIYLATAVHCGGQKDKPVDLKRMERAYDRERKMNL
jgi:hypothetical protein